MTFLQIHPTSNRDVQLLSKDDIFFSSFNGHFPISEADVIHNELLQCVQFRHSKPELRSFSVFLPNAYFANDTTLFCRQGCHPPPK